MGGSGPPPPLPLLRRLADFAAVALPPGSGGTPPLAVLLQKLLGALAATEKFAVQLNPITVQPSMPSSYGYYPRAGLQSE
jgi:hypothetical protein